MLNLITDRTAQDVARWRELKNKGYANMSAAERAEWDGPMKGAYNYTDLNRVENAVSYLAERLNEFGYHVESLETRTWDATSVPTLADMARYLSNVREIRNAFVTLRTTPDAPATMRRMTHVEANAIEQILHDVGMLVENMVASLSYSGDIYGGEI